MVTESAPDRKVIFLTGVTGFLGKVVLEELLRRRLELGVGKAIVLLRPAKASEDASSLVTAAEPSSRFQTEVATSPCFAKLPPSWTDYVQPVWGDVEKPDCGLDPSVYQQICDETTHVVHCAASIKFDLPFVNAASINIQGALHVLQLAQSCSHLERMIYTSTAYVTPHKGSDKMYEKLAPLGPWTSAQALLDDISSGVVNEAQLLRQTGHPNTYALTKCIAEHLVLEGRGSMPLTIVRPSIIAASQSYPFPGWTDNISAIAAVILAYTKCGMRELPGQSSTSLDVVPVDFVADFIINEAFSPQGSSSPSIANCVAGIRDTMELKKLSVIAASYFQQSELQWERHPRSLHALINRLLWQELPLNLLKTSARISGNQRQLIQLQSLKEGLNTLNNTFSYYMSHTFDFVSSRPTAYQNMKGYDQTEYIKLMFRGVQQYSMRTARTRGLVSAEKNIAGRESSNSSDHLVKLFTGIRATWVFRLAAMIIEKVLGRIFDKVTIDQQSFLEALEDYSPETPDHRLLILPTHRSYLDFIICPYLFYTLPQLGIKIPRIAAQNEFAKLPLVGGLMSRLGAFYVQRGVGRADPRLDKQIRSLVEQDEHILFFPEGQRSRTRQFLAPRRGLLRSLQSTGKTFDILPLSISYERVAEEASFVSEMEGRPKPQMSVLGLLSWIGRMVMGRVQLGRVHVKCGKMLQLAPGSDVRSVSHAVMRELQANTVVTTYHIESFVQLHSLQRLLRPGRLGGKRFDVTWLKRQLELRGATVLDGSAATGRVSATLEPALRNQWIHFFNGDMLRAQPRNAAVAHYVSENSYQQISGDVLEDADVRNISNWYELHDKVAENIPGSHLHDKNAKNGSVYQPNENSAENDSGYQSYDDNFKDIPDDQTVDSELKDTEELARLLRYITEPICAEYSAVADGFMTVVNGSAYLDLKASPPLPLLASGDGDGDGGVVAHAQQQSAMVYSYQHRRMHPCLRLLAENGVIKNVNDDSWVVVDVDRLKVFRQGLAV